MLSSRGGEGRRARLCKQGPPPPPYVSLLSTLISEVFATAGAREGVFYSSGWEGLSCSGRFWGLVEGVFVQGAASINMDEESVSEVISNEMTDCMPTIHIIIHG